MYNVRDLMFLYALTSTHVGSGDNLNYIDLPIQREKHTNLPKIEASSLKGSIKQAMGQSDDVHAILGSDDDGEIASAVSFSDAKLLFFPVKSAKGIFAYVTCPLVVKRFISDCKMIGIMDTDTEQEECLSGQKSYIASAVKESAIVFNEKEVVLDEYVFKVESNAGFNRFMTKIQTQLPQRHMLANDFLSRVILLGNDDFSYFVNHSTEVITRIKIGKAGTAENKALFTQENLPPETILYSLLFYTNSKKDEAMSAQEVKHKFNSIFSGEIFQMGGDMTLGKGLFCKKMWIGGENER